jgi:cyclopropane fatty-acyl-phospholipid synthase-like methyltransferase
VFCEDLPGRLINATDVGFELAKSSGLASAGCGAGRLLLPYLRAGLDVDACDQSADMIEVCREKATNEGFEPNLYIQAMHAIDLPRLYRTIIVVGSFGLMGSCRRKRTPN